MSRVVKFKLGSKLGEAVVNKSAPPVSFPEIVLVAAVHVQTSPSMLLPNVLKLIEDWADTSWPTVAKVINAAQRIDLLFMSGWCLGVI